MSLISLFEIVCLREFQNINNRSGIYKTDFTAYDCSTPVNFYEYFE